MAIIFLFIILFCSFAAGQGEVVFDASQAHYPPAVNKFSDGVFFDNTERRDHNEMIARMDEMKCLMIDSNIRESRKNYKDGSDTMIGNDPLNSSNPNGLFYIDQQGEVQANCDLNWIERRSECLSAGLLNYIRWDGVPYLANDDPADDYFNLDQFRGIPAGDPKPSDYNPPCAQADRPLFAQKMGELIEKMHDNEPDFVPTIWSFWQEVEHCLGDPTPWDNNLTAEDKMNNLEMFINDFYGNLVPLIKDVDPDYKIAGIQQNSAMSEWSSFNLISDYGTIGGSGLGNAAHFWAEMEEQNEREYPFDYLTIQSYRGTNIPSHHIPNSRFALKNLMAELHPEKINRFNRTSVFINEAKYYKTTPPESSIAEIKWLLDLADIPELAYASLNVMLRDYNQEPRVRFLEVYSAMPEGRLAAQNSSQLGCIGSYQPEDGFYGFFYNETASSGNADISVEGAGLSLNDEAAFWTLDYNSSDMYAPSFWVQKNDVVRVDEDTWQASYQAGEIMFMAVNGNPEINPGQSYYQLSPESKLSLRHSRIQRGVYSCHDMYVPRINDMTPSQWGYLTPPEPEGMGYFDQQRGRMILGVKNESGVGCASVNLREVPEHNYFVKADFSGVGLPSPLPQDSSLLLRLDYLNGEEVVESHIVGDSSAANPLSFDDIGWFAPGNAVYSSASEIWNQREFILPVSSWQPVGWAEADGGVRRIRISLLLAGLNEPAALMCDFDDTITVSPPEITSQPESKTVPAGQSVQLTISGSDISEYRWHKDGVPIPDDPTNTEHFGEDGPSLVVLNVQPEDEGEYSCVVNNQDGAVAESEPAQVITERLAGWWKFDSDLSDSVNQAHPSAGSHNGAADSPAFSSAGIDGACLNLDGTISSAAVIQGSEDFFNFYTRGYTVSLWVKSESGASEAAGLAGKISQSGSKGFSIGANYLGNAVSILHGGWYYMNSGENVCDESWHLLTAAYDPVSSEGCIYIDGELAKTINSLGAPQGSPAEFVIGASGLFSNDAFNGRIDDVRVWTYPLAPIDAANLYLDFVPEAEICLSYPQYDIAGPDGAGEQYRDCIVDFYDLSAVAQSWLTGENQPGCTTYPQYDFAGEGGIGEEHRDCFVNMYDFIPISSHWLESNIIASQQ
ncbi:LamG-like jellyroll fold domain-containing protein [Sedimentisphaera salicampi]|uniref:LamG-like jellyroll fold domain-containing protein n=1 Tax=Sedimentisphaera salicampi TaxID=1941349 RepID=UPI000B9B7E84|nr:LamG-like jellyroll fold domain-containing protein [Sedimentisphaera salicampi]OXU13963.1 Immunoglobulin I-set domain protein [Sedimentisphaera salicampi]